MRAVQTNKTTSIVSSNWRNTVNNNYTCISLLGSPPSPQFEERWFGGLLCSSTEGSTKSSRSRQKSWNRWKSGKANGSISKVVATSSSGRSISSNTCSAVGRHIRRNKEWVGERTSNLKRSIILVRSVSSNTLYWTVSAENTLSANGHSRYPTTNSCTHCLAERTTRCCSCIPASRFNDVTHRQIDRQTGVAPA